MNVYPWDSRLQLILHGEGTHKYTVHLWVARGPDQSSNRCSHRRGRGGAYELEESFSSAWVGQCGQARHDILAGSATKFGKCGMQSNV